MKNAVRKRIPILLAVSGFFLVLCLFRFIIFIGFVPTISMEPTIQKDSYILAWRVYDDLERGDIIVFRKEGRTHVKRIVAAAGDTVIVDNATGEIWINETLDGKASSLIPNNCYFVMGDNTVESVDSRYWKEPLVSEFDVLAKYIG